MSQKKIPTSKIEEIINISTGIMTRNIYKCPHSSRSIEFKYFYVITTTLSSLLSFFVHQISLCNVGRSIIVHI